MVKKHMEDTVFDSLMVSRDAGELFAKIAGNELRQRLCRSLYLGVSPEHGVAWRVKTAEAIKAKLREKKQEPVVVNDFIGIRVLTAHSECLNDAIREISNWAERYELSEVQRENRFDAPDESGYQAIHIDYEFKHPPKYNLIQEAGVEVQLTTWLRHLHSMLSHRLYYKAANHPDASVLRFLRQLSEHLHQTDENVAEFLKVKATSLGNAPDGSTQNR